MSKKSAIIIGAGVAGIATAIHLAVQGFAVKVFEKNNYVGGKIASFNLDGYQFDEGPSLFTQPVNIEELFTLAGEAISEYFDYQPLSIACKYFYENGKIVNAYINPEAFAQELHEQLGEEPQRVIDYLKQSETVYNKIGSIFLNYSLHSKNILKAPLLQAMAAVKSGLLFQYIKRF